MFVMGDLNTPSHLDWIESAKERHCGWAFPWPATQMLQRYWIEADTWKDDVDGENYDDRWETRL